MKTIRTFITLILFVTLFSACGPVVPMEVSLPTETPEHMSPIATASPTNSGEDLLRWESAVVPCQTAVFSTQGIAFGECGGLLTTSQNLSHVRRLLELVDTYSSFSADTPAGKLTLKGRGTTIATQSEQRAIAEWSNLQFQVAQAGRAGASWGLAFAWHREGGIAGFCDDLTIYLDGSYSVSSCSPNILGNYQSRLSSAQLDTLYSLIDSLKNFEFSDEPSPLPPDYLVIRFVFSGIGDAEAQDADIQAINAFATELINSAQVPASGGGLPPAVLAAMSILRTSLSVVDMEIQVVRLESVEWPDSCLGVYRTDEPCAEVITPGFRVLLSAQGLLYEFHTDFNGDNIRFFGAPQTMPAPG